MQRVSKQANQEAKHLHDVAEEKSKRCGRSEGTVVKGMDMMKIDDEATMVNSLERPTDAKTNGLFYLERENRVLIQNYGPELYEACRSMECKSEIPPNFINRHKVDGSVRTKMIDWMIEVLHVSESDKSTFFLSVHILDLFLFKTKTVLTNSDIHLIGVTCLYIASKMEDIIPLRMSTVKYRIGHGKFLEKDYKNCEKVILETLNFDLVATSSYDFVKTFIFDFCHNNHSSIKALKMSRHIASFESVCVYLAKLMCHSEEFSSYKHSLKALAAIIAAFDILRSNSKHLGQDGEGFMREWVGFYLLRLCF